MLPLRTPIGSSRVPVSCQNAAIWRAFLKAGVLSYCQLTGMSNRNPEGPRPSWPSGHGALHGGCDLRKGLACRMLELTLRRFIMALAPRDRGPRLTVPCVRCGGPSRLKSVEFAMFPNGIQQAIYECDCGGVIKRVLPSQSNQPWPTGSTVDL